MSASTFADGVDFAARLIEALAVLIIVFFVLIATARWLLHSGKKVRAEYAIYRVKLGKALLIGLELLIAADIIRTVIEATLSDMITLGALVLVRTFLGWTITVEVDGRWPWQAAREPPAVEREIEEPRA